MNFKHCHHSRQGSIFLEAVMAIAMAAMLLSSLFALQINVFQRVINNSCRFSHFVTTGSLFQLAVLDRLLGQEKMSYDKQIEEPSMKLTLEISPVKNEGALGRFRRLFIEKVTGTWQEWKGEKQETSVQFTFIPEKQKSDEKNEFLSSKKASSKGVS